MTTVGAPTTHPGVSSTLQILVGIEETVNILNNDYSWGSYYSPRGQLNSTDIGRYRGDSKP